MIYIILFIGILIYVGYLSIFNKDDIKNKDDSNIDGITINEIEEFREKLGITEKKISLGTLSRKLGIENPQAHRALADALTTARVYLELKKMGSSEKAVEIDDLLADLDDW